MMDFILQLGDLVFMISPLIGLKINVHIHIKIHRRDKNES